VLIESADAGVFQRLADFARGIVAVPKHEADAKAKTYRRQKQSHA
jgi:hypothetical protein